MVQCKDPCNPTADEVKACLCDPDCCEFCKKHCPCDGVVNADGSIDWSRMFSLAVALIDAVKAWLAQKTCPPDVG